MNDFDEPIDYVLTEDVCGAWVDSHECRLRADHPGDHVCGGCLDVWNRSSDDDELEEWAHTRPDDRCTDAPDAEVRYLPIPAPTWIEPSL